MNWFDTANNWLAQQLGASTGLASFGLLLVGGILASLLPCVYPLYPITAAILSRRESKLGRAAQPLTYYAGLSAIYFAFGIIASLTGGNFNEVLRLPAMNLAIGGLLFLLALATAGILHFPAWAGVGSSEGSSLKSTFLMGAGAGLLSSACVGPIVVSILVSIASATEEVSAAMAFLAAAKMMLFGLGVGFPLLLIGVFGVALPKAGAWMVRVQQVFGILIAWFSIGYVFKGLSSAGFTDTMSWALLSGVALVGAAAYLIQDAEQLVAMRAKRSILAAAFVVGFFIIGRTLLSTVPVARAAGASGASSLAQAPATEQNGSLTWYLDKEAAYSAAAQTGKPVFVKFHGDWCTNCKAFEENTQSDEELNGALSRAILLKVRDTTALFEEYREDVRFPELKVGLPFFLITDAKEQLLYKTSDYTKSAEMAMFLPEAQP